LGLEEDGLLLNDIQEEAKNERNLYIVKVRGPEDKKTTPGEI
jgi:hypothetical protein